MVAPPAGDTLQTHFYRYIQEKTHIGANAVHMHVPQPIPVQVHTLVSKRGNIVAVGDNVGAVSQMQGVLSQQHCAEPASFERANYIQTLNSFGPLTTRE